MNPLDLETISKDLACIIKGMPIVPENDSNLNPGNAILLVIFLREIFKDQSFNKKLTKLSVFNTTKNWSDFVCDTDFPILILKSIKQIIIIDPRFRSLDSFYLSHEHLMLPKVIKLIEKFLYSSKTGELFSNEAIIECLDKIEHLKPKKIINLQFDSLTLSHLLTLISSDLKPQSILFFYPGHGQTLTSVIHKNRPTIKSIVCQDSDSSSLLICSIKCHLLRFLDYKLSLGPFDPPDSKALIPIISDDKYDLIISTPRMTDWYAREIFGSDGSVTTKPRAQHITLSGFRNIRRHILKLTKSGKLVQLMTNPDLRPTLIRESVSSFLRDDFWESVISLPNWSLFHSNIKLSLGIFHAAKPKKLQGSVFFLNASTSENQSDYTEAQVRKFWEKFFAIYIKKVDDYPFSKLITTDAIIKNNVNLQVNSYADSSEESLHITSLLSEQPAYFLFKLGDPKVTLDSRDVRIEIDPLNITPEMLNDNSGLRDTFDPNCLYISKDFSEITGPELSIDFQDLTIPVTSIDYPSAVITKQYFKLILNEAVVLNSYLYYFYRSTLGKMILRNISLGSWGRAQFDVLKLSSVVIPDIKTQKALVSSVKKIKKLTKILNDYESEIALRPGHSYKIAAKLDEMAESVGMVTTEDRIRSLIRNGESKTLEFKKSFSLDCNEFDKNPNYTMNKADKKAIQMGVIKNIAGFINSEGGTLLIGVDDRGEVTGLESEIDRFHKGSADDFLLHLKDRINTEIGTGFIALYDTYLITVRDKLIIEIQCQKTAKEFIYMNNKLPVRVNPSIQMLEGKDIVDYVGAHHSV